MLCHGTVCVVGKIRDLILQLSKSSIYSTKPDGTVIDLMKDNPESNLAKFTKNIPGNAENHTVCYVRFPS
ncbi:hypothetical protein FQF98_24490 [Escherichia coli]|nr:hypothetical protein [Escherichia coli]EFB5167462.1 hypothetical protein [Escherichia coli]EFN3854477.1 hypothetical protein [Escherichia coli]